MPALLRLCLAIACLLGLAGCIDPGRYPRDPDGTLARVRGGTLRVGVVNDPPFVQAGHEPRGAEAELMRAYARQLGARVAWNHSGHAVLMRELEARRLDAVIGGHAMDSPWAQRVSTSRAFRTADAHGREVDRVLALPPGENAWQLAFERFALTPDAHRALGTTR
jgi:polar amino acid transport system substrate-binding protein